VSPLIAIALAASLSSSLSFTSAVLGPEQQSAVPDAPAPQAPRPLTDVNGRYPRQGRRQTPSRAHHPPRSRLAAGRAQQPGLSIRRIRSDRAARCPTRRGRGKVTTLVQHVNFVDVRSPSKDSAESSWLASLPRLQNLRE